MRKPEIDNLGIPPLAGIASYEAAAGNTGYSVDQMVDRLKRLNYIKKRLLQTAAAHLAAAPEWEVKCALGYHMWLDAEHCKSIRDRVGEMREPPLHLDKVPDPRLQSLMDEVIRTRSTLELLVGVYRVIRTEVIRSIRLILSQSNPIADQPTHRILKIILMEEQEMADWGEQAVQALLLTEDNRSEASRWTRHLVCALQISGGITHDLQILEQPSGERRSDGQKFEMDPVPRRDRRFRDHFNQSALIDEYYKDKSRTYEEKAYALIYKRLREMDVPEWMAPIIYKTEGKPWQYYVDMSRQLWDETRHAMLGEIGLISGGIPFYKYPVDMKSSMALNTEFTPEDAHLVLWIIEQNLMPYAEGRGKQYEWEVAKECGIPIAVMIQDYDWADEVLHAQIGRRWVVPAYGSIKQALEAGGPVMSRWRESFEKMGGRSENQPWWPELVEDIARSR